MKCPFWKICPTPNWYANDESHRRFIECTCLSIHSKECTHYQSLLACPPSNAVAKTIIKSIQKHPFYKNRYIEDNPSRRDNDGN